MHKRWLFILIILPILVFSQEDQNLLLANQFYQNKEYTKAIPLYKKIIKSDFDKYIYKNLFNAYLQTKDYDNALKLTKLGQKKSKYALIYQIDEGHILQLDQKDKKAKEQFDDVLKNIPTNEYYVNIIANSFSKYQLLDCALNTYKKGQQNLKNRSLFIEEVAKLYLEKQEYSEAFQQYLLYLDFFPNKLEYIDGEFNRICDTEEKKKTLKSILFRSVQKNPNKLFYIELLVSNLIHLQEYNEAFIQVNALDKKSNAGGRYLMRFSEELIQIENYEYASKALDEIKKTGNNYYSFLATKKSLEVKLNLLESKYPIDLNLVNNLIKEFEQFLNKHGYTIKTYEVAKNMAYLSAFYLEDYTNAINIINNVLNTSSIDRNSKGEIKLLKGDIELLSGKKWDAQLTYWQVDKDFKEGVLAHKAKYKVALLSYYAGDFKWCQNQLNALKGSTTKLISNDAIYLSTFITENYEKDSAYIPVKLYAEAELLIYQKQYSKALLKYDTMIDINSEHILMDDIQMKKAEIALAQNDESTAIKHLQTIIDKHNNDLLLDDAIFKLAEIYYQYEEHQDKAKELYNLIFNNHKDSIYVTESRKKFRMLRGDNLN